MNNTPYIPPDLPRYLVWSAALGALIGLAVAAGAAAVPKLDMLYMENGPMENMSMALWLLSATAAAVAYRRWTGPVDRMAAFWIATIACLAALREADAHILLNPEVIGRFGVRYRIDWILNPDVSLLIKLGYAALFALILSSVFVPALRLRQPFWRLFRGGDAFVGMLGMAGAGMALGFVMDDLLRGSPLMTKGIRQLTEETCEFLGAIAFCAAALLVMRRSVTGRLQRLPEEGA